MNPVYIRATGIHAEHCDDLGALNAVLSQKQEGPCLSGQDIYQPIKVRLSPSEQKVIAREDRSILNDLSTCILNAAGDMLQSAGLESLVNAEDTPLYVGSDGGSEYNMAALNQLIERFKSPVATLNHLGLLSSMTNPIQMMRMLSTNPLYHASKRMQLRGGGYPTRCMSLSGVSALEDACADIAAGRSQQGVVIAAGSMRNFDSLVVFGKLGLLGENNDSATIQPSFGAAALLLDQDASKADAALAKILKVSTRYSAEHFPSEDDWKSLLHDVAACGLEPDLIVTYCNGVKANNESELAAIAQVFADAELRNYKPLFGYTGKANNLLDLAAVLADETVAVGTRILVLGAGFCMGIGYMLVEKLNHAKGCSSPTLNEGNAK